MASDPPTPAHTEHVANPSVLDRTLFAAPRERTLPIYRWLRDEAPVYWDEASKVWCLSRYEDVVWASKDQGLFSSARLGSRPNVPSVPSMINQDEPHHGLRRRFVSRGFTPNQLRHREREIRAIASGLVDAIAPRGECDFVQEVAQRLPLAMIGTFLGFPEADWPKLGRWSDMLTLGSDSFDPDVAAQCVIGFAEYSEYVLALAAARRREPTDDLISILVHAEIDGVRLSDEEIAHEVLLLLVGGSETSRNVIGGAVHLLSRFPEQKRILLDDPGKLPVAVEEFIRWVSPVLNMQRSATRDVERRGVRIREGDPVVLLYPSANFDERVFDDPDRLDVERRKNPHVAFGIGNHFCLGANLAKLQIRILLEELLARLPDIHTRPGFEPVYPPSAFVCGFLNLPVEFTPA